MSKKSDKRRYSVTLTKAFNDALKKMVEMGIYLDTQDVIRDSLRQLFRFHRIDQFHPELVEEVEKVEKVEEVEDVEKVEEVEDVEKDS